MSGKRLEILKETNPKLSALQCCGIGKVQALPIHGKKVHPAAKELRLQLDSMEVNSADKYESAFKEATKAGSAAFAVTLSPLANANQKRIADLATKNRLAAIYPRGDFVASGGLMSYGADRSEPLQACRDFCGQDSQRDEARRHSCRATEKI